MTEQDIKARLQAGEIDEDTAVTLMTAITAGDRTEAVRIVAGWLGQSDAGSLAK